jgi:hypothetical protein
MALAELNLKMEYTGCNITESGKALVEAIHYSHTARSQQQVHVFTLSREGRVVGCAIFGKPMSRHYDSDTLELRRFVLVQEMPKNTESFFLSKCLKWIQKNDRSIVRIVTFADPNQGHEGTIYKASNFLFDGEENSANPRIVVMGDKTIHMRQAYQKRKGEYTRDACRIQQAILSGAAEMRKQKRKLRYVYWFRK